MTRAPGTRILALDLHPQRYGFAVLETPAELLDWGVRRRYRREKSRAGNRSLCRRLRFLLELWRPSLVVIKEQSKRRMARMQRLLAGINAEVRRCRISVRRVPERAVRSAFGDKNGGTKYEMSSTLLQHFPFLASALPPKRRIWESEDYRMSIFAPVALALTASGQKLAAIR